MVGLILKLNNKLIKKDFCLSLFFMKIIITKNEKGIYFFAIKE